LFLLIKHYAMKTYGEVDVFLTSVLIGNDCGQFYVPVALHQEQELPGTHWIEILTMWRIENY
jgi:hypothetical protein